MENRTQQWKELVDQFFSSKDYLEKIDIGDRISWYFPSVGKAKKDYFIEKLNGVTDDVILEIISAGHIVFEEMEGRLQIELIYDLFSYLENAIERLRTIKESNDISITIKNEVQEIINYLADEEEAKQYDYDVALSFAGEDRLFVERVAKILTALGLKVFYDKHEVSELWGKDLYSHLDDVYRKKSKYCMIFVSRAYSEKIWTNHERMSAQARALQDTNQEYLLPVRLDDTELPGLKPTIGYLDARDTMITAEELAYLTAEKINPKLLIDELLNVLKEYFGEAYSIDLVGEYVVLQGQGEYLKDYRYEIPIRILLPMYEENLLWDMFIMQGIIPE